MTARRNMVAGSMGPRRRLKSPTNIIVGAGLNGVGGNVPPPENVELLTSTVTFNNSAGTTQDVDNDFGRATLAALSILAHNTVSGTAVADAGICLGFTDGTSHAMVGGRSEDGTASSDSQGYKNSGYAIGSFDEIALAPKSRATASFYSGPPYGTRYTWDSSNAAGDFIGAVMQIGGTDVTTAFVQHAFSVSQDATEAVTGVGFAPDVVIALCGKVGNNSGNMTQHNVAGFGFAVKGGNQASVAQYCRDARNPSELKLVNSDSYFFSAMNAATDSFLEMTSFDADGFTVTARNSGMTATQNLLCIKLEDSADASVTHFDFPTSTGELEVNVGFRPRQLILIANNQTATDSVSTTDDGGLTISVMDGDDQFCASSFIVDGVTPTETQSIGTNQAIKIVNASATTIWEATLTGFTSTGFTLDFTTVQGTAIKASVLAFR